MKRSNTKLISLIIQDFIKEEGLADGLNRVRIFNAWDLVVGKNGAAATLNKYYKDKTLYCTVNSSIVRTQLYYKKEDIVAQMNKMLNDTLIEKLVIR
ncbi:MAG: DUF721 domain-containing protein [Bacteroidia bacterium]|nr:DUF721 domain-containing protein [Bacteroidia bacterium]